MSPASGMRQSIAHRVALMTLPVLALAIAILGIIWADSSVGALGQPDDGSWAFIGAIGILSFTAVCVGVTILWQKPDNRIGVLLIVGALMIETGITTWPVLILRTTALGPDDLIAGIANWWGTIGMVPGVVLLFPVVGILFPDGRLPGPRWRLPLLIGLMLLIAGMVVQTFVPCSLTENCLARSPFGIEALSTDMYDLGGALSTLGAIGLFAVAAAAMTVRYRRSTGIERTQVKWPVASLALIAIAYPVSAATDNDAIDLLSVVIGCLVPIAIGIAILRYRLFEIDRIVSRTIAYVVITAVLAGAYAGVILVLQGPLGAVTGGDTIPVAISTLVVAALFQPLRRRVQSVVDRRFDRARFDAERTSIAFSERLRADVNIESVTSDLRTTVRAAIAPSTVGLWLRGSDR